MNSLWSTMMTQKRFAAIVISMLLALVSPIQAQSWQLVWSDEFQYDGLPDASKWGYDVGGTGWGNNELQYYTENDLDNARVDGENLIIEAHEENFGGNSYTSARLITKNMGDWKYGRIEIRAIMPTGQGLWPANWLLPTDWVHGGWAASGEIDIMELVGHEPQTVHGTLHYGGSWPLNVFTGVPYSLSSGTFNDDFHVFVIEWEPDEFRWYVDDVHYQTQNSWYSTEAIYPAPYDERFHLLLNVAVGGTWPGPPNNDTEFPQQMVIDYVRVYQDVNSPSIEITEPANSAEFDAGSSLTIRAMPTVSNSVDQVDFYQDDALLGSVTTEPYELEIADLVDGDYRLRAVVQDDSGRVSYSEFVDISVGSGGQGPFTMQPLPIPGVIEAEFFDNGGQGVSYSDFDTQVNNGCMYSGNIFRSHEGVDIEETSDAGGGYNLGWVEGGEYLEYTVDVESTGKYDVDVRLASPSGGGTFSISFDGANLSGLVTVPASGGWQNWVTTRVSGLELTEGIHIFRFNCSGGGFNLNRFTVNLDPTGIGTGENAGSPHRFALAQNYPNPFNPTTKINYSVAQSSHVNLTVFNMLGEVVKALVNETMSAGVHEIYWDGTDQFGNAVASGIYLYRLEAADPSGSSGQRIVQTHKMLLNR